MFREVLQEVVEKTDGGIAAILMGYDGIPVEQYVEGDAVLDVETIGMEYSVILKMIKNAAEMLDIGAAQRGGASEIGVRATAPKIAFDAAVGRALEGKLAEGELSSRTAPAAMVSQLAASLGGGIQIALTDEALVMGAVLPVR